MMSAVQWSFVLFVMSKKTGRAHALVPGLWVLNMDCSSGASVTWCCCVDDIIYLFIYLFAGPSPVGVVGVNTASERLSGSCAAYIYTVDQ